MPSTLYVCIYFHFREVHIRLHYGHLVFIGLSCLPTPYPVDGLARTAKENISKVQE